MDLYDNYRLQCQSKFCFASGCFDINGKLTVVAAALCLSVGVKQISISGCQRSLRIMYEIIDTGTPFLSFHGFM